VKDYVASWRQRTQEMFVPLVHPPGHGHADSDAIGVIGAVAASNEAAPLMSATCPPVSRKACGRPSSSTSAWIFVVRPPRERPMA
jgi:hypothetical protein